MALEARAALKQINTYTPARSLESIQREYGFEKVIKLAGNENNLGCSPMAKAALSNSLEGLSYYPDPFVTQLREKLSVKHKVNGSQLIFGNGSFELISLIAYTFLNAGDEAIMAEPSFSWYKNVTLTAGGKIISIPLKDYRTDLEAIKKSITIKTKIIWICNPNNPTGTQVNQKDFENFIEGIRDDIVIVVDEAYIDFTEEEDIADVVGNLNKYKNLISLRTFSKLYGLASLRIGYGIASEELINFMIKAQTPINVNQLAQTAALTSLEDIEFKEYVLENSRRSKKLYYATLERLGLKYIKSNGNFIMFDLGSDSDFCVFEYLKRGILIRGGKEFGMPTWVRVSIGKYEENELVLDLLEQLLELQTQNRSCK